MRQLFHFLLLTVLLATGACASGGARPKTGERSAPSRRMDLITVDEIERRQWANAYDMIQQLRGSWLSDRGEDTIMGVRTEIQVHLDDMRVGTVASLRSIPVTGIRSARFYSGIEASARWGLGYGKGVIELTTLSSAREP